MDSVKNVETNGNKNSYNPIIVIEKGGNLFELLPQAKIAVCYGDHMLLRQVNFAQSSVG